MRPPLVLMPLPLFDLNLKLRHVRFIQSDRNGLSETHSF